MFRFANKEFLYLFFLLPILIGAFVAMAQTRKKAFRKFSERLFWPTLSPLQSPARRNMKFVLFLLAISSVIIAMARPQFGSRLEEVKREGIEMIIALDVSKSMLAEDIKPNRLTRAKQAISSLVNRMKDDKIGMIVFAGDAYTQLPITTDYISARLFLDNINTNIVSKQGTAIASAIELGIKSFSPDAESSKVIVIISDGENHEGDAVDAARQAVEKGIKIYTIGMGSPDGTPIPVDARGGVQQGFLKDRNGQVVMSKMNPKMMGEIAAAGDGRFYVASTGNVGLNQLYNELNKLEKSEIETKKYSEYDDQFHYFAAFSVLMLIINVFIMERRSKYFKTFNLFRET
jgi:Ca-activated chloride channel family protein